MPFVDFAAIRRAIGLERALHVLGWRASSYWGGSVRGPCPFKCSDTRCRPFQVQPGRGYWRCWRCRRHGDVVELWGQIHQMSPYMASLHLCDTFGIEVPLKDG